jgi:spore coat protein CotF
LQRSYAMEDGSLSSMEMAQDILECHKALACEYTKAALESSEPSVRRTFRQLGRDCERVAFHAWEVLHEHGHYPIKSAPQSECQQVEQMIESFQHGAAVPNAQGTSSQRWGRASNYGGAPDRYGTTTTERYGASTADRYVGSTTDRYGAGVDRYATTTADRFGPSADRYTASTDRYPSSADRMERNERGELPDWARARN